MQLVMLHQNSSGMLPEAKKIGTKAMYELLLAGAIAIMFAVTADATIASHENEIGDRYRQVLQLLWNPVGAPFRLASWHVKVE